MGTTEDAECRSQSMPGGRCVVPWLLALAVWSSVFLGPLWLSSWVAGFLNSAFLWILSGACFFLLGWSLLFVLACIRFVQGLRSPQKVRAVLWLSIAVGIVLAFAQYKMDKTRSPHACFGRGLLARLEVRTDIDAVRTWVASLDPNDCLPVPHDASRGRNLHKEQRPEVLRRQSGMVSLELDAEGRPSARLRWDQSRAGVFGLVIGHRDMRTPSSEPGMYGEKRTRLRPGVYFWYEES